MKTRIAALAATVTLMVSAGAIAAAPAYAERVPGKPSQFYAFCFVDLLGAPAACAETEKDNATHICQYVLTPFGLIGLDCIQE
ncbi:hypothetical protein ACFQ05_23335 [Amycolatopsis umgeniensis]|uniref:Uncharacterized protein n=1 Tax=Amycolatopsis umgeniensis TaxID=336628 RepID=A0A841AUV1_9PSEU|nr:hypothetical protein [Amycolatopsis umgeniensis]MBB5850145.1 hypothetical protein [Amycolatopsis umgeniensis]